MAASHQRPAWLAGGRDWLGEEGGVGMRVAGVSQ